MFEQSKKLNRYETKIRNPNQNDLHQPVFSQKETFKVVKKYFILQFALVQGSNIFVRGPHKLI